MDMSTQAANVAQLMPAQRVTITLAAQLTGLTPKAIERKIECGYWAEGREYFRDPQGGRWVDIPAVMRWIARGKGGC
jgi:hypothetical protein